jgi:hypothetical protein
MKKKALFILILVLSTSLAQSQKRKKSVKTPASTLVEYNNLEWRNIGPFRGGRSVTLLFIWGPQAEESGKR